jgi:hypothetical protein
MKLTIYLYFIILFCQTFGQNKITQITGRDTIYLKDITGTNFKDCFKNSPKFQDWYFYTSPGNLIFPKGATVNDTISDYLYYSLNNYKPEKLSINNLPPEINYFIPSAKFVLKDKNKILWTNQYTHVVTDNLNNFINYKQYPFIELGEQLDMVNVNNNNPLFILENRILFPCRTNYNFRKQSTCENTKVKPYSRFISIGLDYFLTEDTLANNYEIIEYENNLVNLTDTFKIIFESYWADPYSKFIVNVDPTTNSLVSYDFKNKQYKFLQLPPNPITSIPQLIQPLNSYYLQVESDFFKSTAKQIDTLNWKQEFSLNCIPDENLCIRSFGITIKDESILKQLCTKNGFPMENIHHPSETVFVVYQYLSTSPNLEVIKEIIVPFKDFIHVLKASKESITGIRLIYGKGSIQPAVITWHLEN